MQKKQKYIHKSKYIDPISVAKVPQILQDIGQLETVYADPMITMEEADAAIQGFKGKVRQRRQYGRFDPIDLIESNREAQQLIKQFTNSIVLTSYVISGF
ncbi:MAG: hypothetical protein EZS28_015369 [Streblomastix strix]|uniref:Uncharacterized protein n=1 Tax=Streblomastix strix TaxID=222440 RepID=A0A5J4W2J4_9EUKA|nr:MAG: hypothetical protein EZS28_015369 [Streblomastix strix]